MSHFVPVIPVYPDTTPKEMPRIKLMTALLTRRILNCFLNMNSIAFSVSNHSECPGLTVNTNAPFCFGCMECLDF